ncbi:calcium-binding protein [Streptomyces inusitatus]|uniref:Calcium-binding protein n=1 Tax=Streptomyces inusitatus TaxID=68221 RepID=A0A918QA99_9ACTN|nr:EF-hand domain-containing protein [Streptomyces inusitatus]GGZ39635.1 calcium-binding protein [Streptomyces inusitatus]
MRTEALNRVRLVFALFDVNGNGVLEAADFELMADRVRDAVPGAEAAAQEAMAAAFRRYWDTLVEELDTDGDGRVDFDEYVACVLVPERFEGAAAEFAGALSTVGDLRGDGRVGRAEFVALMIAIGFAPANIQALFDALGPDEEDRVASEAWDASIREYYQPDADGTVGDLLVAAPAG